MDKKALRALREDPAEYQRRFERADKLGTLLGAKIVSITKDECVFEYQVNPDHFNPNRILHGGTLFSVMDSSQGAFLHFILDEKFRFAATGTATVKYLAPVTHGKIKIRTWLAAHENRKFFIKSEASDESGQAVAVLDEIWIAVLEEPKP